MLTDRVAGHPQGWNIYLDIHTQARLTLAVRIFAKREFISENAKTNKRSFATFAKQYLVGSIRYNFEICERK